LDLPGELAVKRILKPVTYVLAALYFLADAAFMAVAKPISDWLARHVVLRQLRDWIRSLRPYPSLALFSVPVIMLEPVKPVAAYLAATGQIVSGVITLIVGELLKLVLVERLFSLTRDKLMKIPAFAWAYAKFREAKEWLEATEAWQAIRAISKAARQYLADMKNRLRWRFANLESLRLALNPREPGSAQSESLRTSQCSHRRQRT
jgi:hypothetical protein